MEYIDEGFIREKIFRRDRASHKGNFGKVLVFAGSLGMAGAAQFAGKGALLAGAGLVRFLLPSLGSALCPVLQISVPEATCVGYKAGMDLSEYNVCVAGCGLGTSPQAKAILTYIIENFKGTLVLDADALNIIAADKEKRVFAPADIILTPHVGEARRLLNPAEYKMNDEKSRMEAARALAEKYNAVAVLKGAGTLVAWKNTDVYKNTTGNPGMATGGSGDVMAGIIGGLAAQGYSPEDAARIGVFVHGKAGDIAAEKFGEMSLTAGDIIKCLPEALKLYYPED